MMKRIEFLEAEADRLCGCGRRESLHKVTVQGGAYCQLAEARGQRDATIDACRLLIQQWRNRAEPNFADPDATSETLAYWEGAKRCADELEAKIVHDAERAATKVVLGSPNEADS